MGACCTKDARGANRAEYKEQAIADSERKEGEEVEEHGAKPMPLLKAQDTNYDTIFTERAVEIKSHNTEVNVKRHIRIIVRKRLRSKACTDSTSF